MLADNYHISPALAQLNAVGLYCDEAETTQRFSHIIFLGPGRFADGVRYEIATGFGCKLTGGGVAEEG